MLRKVKGIFIVSLLLNLLFVFAGGYVVYSKGGVNYIKERLQIAVNAEENYDSLHYLERVTVFNETSMSKNSNVFLGDSITEYNNWSEMFINHEVANRGIAGDTTTGVLNRLGELVEQKPKSLFLMIGTNDLNQGIPQPTILSNYKEIVNIIQNGTPETKIFIQSVLPTNDGFINGELRNNEVIIEFNKELENLSNELNVDYIDLYPLYLNSEEKLDEKYTFDGLHLTGKGYLLWANTVKNYIK